MTTNVGSFHSKRKINVSFCIRNEVEPRNRLGINALQYDARLRRLYTAGRDSIIRCWDPYNDKNPYVGTFEHHSDWINSIVLCQNGKTLLSASSDTTLNVWNVQTNFCLSTLRSHKDYVKALAYAKDKELVASGGFDKQILLWDVNVLTSLTTTNNTVMASSLFGQKESIYSLAMNSSGTLIISGSTEKVLRVWDPRTHMKLMKLKGHTDNVKTVVIKADGSECLSGSSDGTVRLWSIGQQRCIATYKIHNAGVWTLVADENFNYFYSSGKDKKIYYADLNIDDSPTLLIEEKNPVLCMQLIPDPLSLWVGTTGSDLNCWPVKLPENAYTESGVELDTSMTPTVQHPLSVIPGAPSIKQIHVCNNKRHVLTKNSVNEVELWDVLKAKRLKSYGDINFDDECTKRKVMIHVPNWFTVDAKTGMLNVTLDESDCFSSWLVTEDAPALPIEDPIKAGGDNKFINYGVLLLRALFEHWPETKPVEYDEKEGLNIPTSDLRLKSTPCNGFFSVAPHTPMTFVEGIGCGRTFVRFLVGEARRESETSNFAAFIPSWVTDIVVKNDQPKFNKITFMLIPLNNNSKSNNKRDRLTASDMIHVRKVMEHVYEKYVLADGNSSNNDKPAMAPEDLAELAETKIELHCNDMHLDSKMDLRTIRHFIWRSSSDLVLNYRVLK